MWANHIDKFSEFGNGTVIEEYFRVITVLWPILHVNDVSILHEVQYLQLDALASLRIMKIIITTIEIPIEKIGLLSFLWVNVPAVIQYQKQMYDHEKANVRKC